MSASKITARALCAEVEQMSVAARTACSSRCGEPGVLPGSLTG